MSEKKCSSNLHLGKKKILTRKTSLKRYLKSTYDHVMSYLLCQIFDTLIKFRKKKSQMSDKIKSLTAFYSTFTQFLKIHIKDKYLPKSWILMNFLNFQGSSQKESVVKNLPASLYTSPKSKYNSTSTNGQYGQSNGKKNWILIPLLKSFTMWRIFLFSQHFLCMTIFTMWKRNNKYVAKNA